MRRNIIVDGELATRLEIKDVRGSVLGTPLGLDCAEFADSDEILVIVCPSTVDNVLSFGGELIGKIVLESSTNDVPSDRIDPEAFDKDISMFVMLVPADHAAVSLRGVLKGAGGGVGSEPAGDSPEREAEDVESILTVVGNI